MLLCYVWCDVDATNKLNVFFLWHTWAALQFWKHCSMVIIVMVLLCSFAPFLTWVSLSIDYLSSLSWPHRGTLVVHSVAATPLATGSSPVSPAGDTGAAASATRECTRASPQSGNGSLPTCRSEAQKNSQPTTKNPGDGGIQLHIISSALHCTTKLLPPANTTLLRYADVNWRLWHKRAGFHCFLNGWVPRTSRIPTGVVYWFKGADSATG